MLVRKRYEKVFQYNPDFPIRVFYESQRDCQPHNHEFVEVVFVTHGEADYYTEVKGFEQIRRGDILVIPPEGVHKYSNTRNLHIINMLFDPRRLPLPLLELYNHPGYKQIFLPDHKHFKSGKSYPHLFLSEEKLCEFEEIMHHFIQTEQVASQGNNCCRLGFFMVTISRLCDLWQDYRVSETLPALDVAKVTHFLNQNFNRPICLDDLVRLTAMGKNTLLRHFSRSMGYSPMEYVQHLRLTYASSMLLNSNMGIEEIASQAGFADPAYFSRIFKKKYGISPRTYRLGPAVT